MPPPPLPTHRVAAPEMQTHTSSPHLEGRAGHMPRPQPLFATPSHNANASSQRFIPQTPTRTGVYVSITIENNQSRKSEHSKQCALGCKHFAGYNRDVVNTRKKTRATDLDVKFALTVLRAFCTHVDRNDSSWPESAYCGRMEGDWPTLQARPAMAG